MKASNCTKMNSSQGYQTEFVTERDILIIDHMEGGKIFYLIVLALFLLEKNSSARGMEQC